MAEKSAIERALDLAEVRSHARPLRLKIMATVNLGPRLEVQPPKIRSKAEGIRVQGDKNATNRQ